MDNLTHSLAGALLGRMGLKRLSPRAMPALIISANLPDIDSWIARPLGLSPRTFHRGFTHGIGGLVVLPFVTVAIIWLWERLRPSNTPPLDGEGKGWGDDRHAALAEIHPHPTLPHGGGGLNVPGLLLACFLGVLSHPLLDFMNTYGVRFLEPVSHRWFYGDILFIVDPWLWIAMIVGLELSWRAERLGRDWTLPAIVVGLGILAYIGLNAAISASAVAATRPLVERFGEPRMIVAGELPLTSWNRQVMWRTDKLAGTAEYSPFSGVRLDPKVVPLGLDDPRLAAAAGTDPQVRDFLFWSRMPLVIHIDGKAYLSDQRFPALRTVTFMVPLDKPGASS